MSVKTKNRPKLKIGGNSPVIAVTNNVKNTTSQNRGFDITCGNDPEFMIRNLKNSEVTSAIEVLKGHDKENKIDLGNGAGFYSDNLNCEISMGYGCSKEELIEIHRSAYQAAAKALGKDYDFVPKPYHIYHKRFLNCDKAKEFGCSASFSAWDLCQLDPPKPPQEGGRSTGCHFHFSRTDRKKYEDYDDIPLLDAYSRVRLMCLMDLFVGLPLTLMDISKESKMRKSLYGVASEHRVNPITVEYRVPSSYVSTSPQLLGFVHSLAMLAVEMELEGKAQDFIDKFDCEVIKNTINKGDEDAAMELIEKVNLPKDFLKTVFSYRANPLFYGDFYKNWGIKV